MEQIDDITLLDTAAALDRVIQCDYKNPFYVPFNASDNRFTKTKILSQTYDRIIIVCLRNDHDTSENNAEHIKLFFDKNTDVAQLMELRNLISFVLSPFALVNMPIIRSGMTTVSTKILRELLQDDLFSTSDQELVYLMLESKKIDVQEWMTIYDTPKPYLSQFFQKKMFFRHYGLSDTTIDKYLIKLLSGISDHTYWDTPSNGMLSENRKFMERKFNMKFKWDIPIEKIEIKLQEIIKELHISKNYGSDYPPSKEKTRFDPKKTHYPITNISKLTIPSDMIAEFLSNDILSEREKYYLICNLLIHKDYCHYVFQKKILNECQQIFSKYAPVFLYLIKYAWFSLVHEENILKSHTKETDRYVIDIDVACKLPVYKFSHYHPNLNPYLVNCISETCIHLRTNIMGVKQNIICQDGIVNITEFKERLNIFMTGTAETDVFDGCCWDHMVITGGIMAALMPKYNPLLSTNPTNDFNIFCDTYYADADVDMACDHSDMVAYVENVIHTKNMVYKNLTNKYADIKDADLKITPEKTLAIYIDEECLKKQCLENTHPFTYEYIMENKQNLDVKHYFYGMYTQKKLENDRKTMVILGDKIKNPIYYELVKITDISKIVIVINNVSRPVHEIKPDQVNTIFYEFDQSDSKNVFIKFTENLKYKISSKFLKRPLEIFRIRDICLAGAVARFHLPCVRSYYNGTTCKLLPSAISAYMTLVNRDIQYFVGKHDPINIINKYRRRGYGTILNKMEIGQMLSYIASVGEMIDLYEISRNNPVKNILGPLSATHTLFGKKADYGLFETTHNELEVYYRSNYPLYNLDINIPFNDVNGNILPVKKWVIDAGFDVMNRS